MRIKMTMNHHVIIKYVKYFQVSILSFIVLSFAGFGNCSSLPEPKKSDNQVLGDYTYAKERINWLVLNKKEEWNVKGLSISVLVDDENIFLKGYGISNKKGDKINENTLFKIGSVSKIFTGLCVMKLAEEGKIDLDEIIIKYLPDLKIHTRYEGARLPTVRELLFHHGGMPSDIFQGFFYKDGEIPSGYEREYTKVLERLDGYTAQNPGVVMAYSNLSFSILGILVERMSGKTLEEYAREKIFIPLGMKNTSYLDNLPSELISQGFSGSKEKQVPKIRDLPAGSISSSALELTNFMKMIFFNGNYNGNTVFNSSTLSKMYDTQNKSALYDSNFKIGLVYWIYSEIDEHKRVGHGGDLPPFHAAILLDIKNQIGVSILVNSNTSSLQLMNLAIQIHDTVLESKSGYRPKQTPSPRPVKFVKSEMKKFEGQYIVGGQVWEVSTSFWDRLILGDKGIYLQPMDDGKFDSEVRIFFGLIPLSKSLLKGIRFYFEESKDKKKLIFQEFMGLTSPMIEYSPLPVLDSWKNRAGNYKVLNPEKEQLFDGFSIDYDKKNDRLNLTYKIDVGIFIRIPFEVILITEREDSAFVAGVGRNLGESVYITRENSKEILNFMGYKLVKKE